MASTISEIVQRLHKGKLVKAFRDVKGYTWGLAYVLSLYSIDGRKAGVTVRFLDGKIIRYPFATIDLEDRTGLTNTISFIYEVSELQAIDELYHDGMSVLVNVGTRKREWWRVGIVSHHNNLGLVVRLSNDILAFPLEEFHNGRHPDLRWMKEKSKVLDK